MRHAFFDTTDNDDNRGRSRQSLIAERRQSERKCDRDAGEHKERNKPNKENQKVQITKTFEERLQKKQTADNDRACRDGPNHVPPIADFQ
jgi:hypothetical protein